MMPADTGSIAYTAGILSGTFQDDNLEDGDVLVRSCAQIVLMPEHASLPYLEVLVATSF